MKIYSYNDRRNICGERVRSAREKRGLSQEQLAAKMQVEGIQLSQKAISRIETGERVVADYELMTFSKVFGISADILIGRIV